MAYYLVNKMESAEYLPQNYKHTFIIRDPKKTVYSLYKMSLNKELTGILYIIMLEPIRNDLHTKIKCPLFNGFAKMADIWIYPLHILYIIS